MDKETESPLSLASVPCEEWYASLFRLRRGSLEWCCHTLMVLIILAGIRLVECVIRLLWGGDKVLFGRLPVQYIFDGADLALLGFFVSFGVVMVLYSYFRRTK